LLKSSAIPSSIRSQFAARMMDGDVPTYRDRRTV
jgi:hypothetical protein